MREIPYAKKGSVYPSLTLCNLLDRACKNINCDDCIANVDNGPPAEEEVQAIVVGFMDSIMPYMKEK